MQKSKQTSNSKKYMKIRIVIREKILVPIVLVLVSLRKIVNDKFQQTNFAAHSSFRTEVPKLSQRAIFVSPQRHFEKQGYKPKIDFFK